MADLDKALQTQIANLQSRSGKSLDELFGLLRDSHLEKHGQLRDLLKTDLGMGAGDANTVVHLFLNPDAMAPKGSDDATAALEAIYTGPKAGLRALHDAVMAGIGSFGDFEIAPKKAYVSLRRKRQFAMVGPGTNALLEVGINMRDVEGTPRLKALPPGGMCQFKVRLGTPAEVDAELLGWLRTAFDQAG
jgi:Domain of unknown function (DUF5655)/Domain of unknown function (DUF4287)